MKSEELDYPDYPVFKGLQKPLEFMGLEGRYITWGVCTLGGGIFGFFLFFIIFGFWVALVVVTLIVGFGIVMIFLKQRKGLHSKREDKGTFVFYHTSIL